jgi:hypothetical protein
VPDQSSADECQREQAVLFTALYGLGAQSSARAFLAAFADVASLFAQYAPLGEDRTDWQCVAGALACCLDRARDP